MTLRIIIIILRKISKIASKWKKIDGVDGDKNKKCVKDR